MLIDAKKENNDVTGLRSLALTARTPCSHLFLSSVVEFVVFVVFYGHILSFGVLFVALIQRSG